MKDHIPEFNFKNVTSPFKDPLKFAISVVNERKRVCDPIFKRIYQLTDEFSEKVAEINKLKESLETTRGFFKRLKIYSKIWDIEGEIDIIRMQLKSLYNSASRRIYA